MGNLKNYKRYPLNQCALYKCVQKKKLCQFLGTTSFELKAILNTIEYKQFFIPKKNSQELRTITTPIFALKQIQKRIFVLLKKVERPDWLMSGEKGKNYVTNAEYHVANSYCLIIDINKFYDKCQREYVYSFFKNKLRCAPDIAKILTDLSTYQGGIPTGTSVSQILAYYAYEEMFKEIKTIADQYGVKFSLYVDDMTFSSDKYFSINKLIYEIRGCLNKYGHTLKQKKTRFYAKNTAKCVTGVIITVNKTLAVPNGKRKEIMEGLEKLNDGTMDLKDAKILVGRVSAARQIEPKSFPSAKRNATKKLKELQEID